MSRSWQHYDLQALRVYSSPWPNPRPNILRSRSPSRCLQRGPRRRRCRSIPNIAPHNCQSILHRPSLNRLKSSLRSSSRHEIRDHGTRRQITTPDPPRRRHRTSSRRSNDGEFLLHRSSMHKRHPCFRPRISPPLLRENPSLKNETHTPRQRPRSLLKFRPSSIKTPL